MTDDDSSKTRSSRPLTKKKSTLFTGPCEIDPDEIIFTDADLIGKGNFGQVFHGRCRSIDVAVKIPKNQNLTAHRLESFRKEMEIMSKLYHPNVCLFMGASTTPSKIRIVTELLEGDLESLMAKEDQPLSQRIKWAKDAAMGIAWLHQTNPPVIHRDLKRANLLYDSNGRIKVSDFGLSHFQEGVMFDTNPKGTPLYMAPEVMLKEVITEKVDVYSFGIILWELVTKQEAFQHHTNYQAFVEAVCCDGERPVIPKDCPESLATFMQRCWDEDPRKRPPFSEIVDKLDSIIADCELWEHDKEIESSVEDPVGVLFWKRHFRSKAEVKWMQFVNAFYEFFGKPMPKEPVPSALTSASEEELKEFKSISPEWAQAVKDEVKRRKSATKSATQAYQNYGVTEGTEVSDETRELFCLKGIFTDEKDGLVKLKRFGEMLTIFGPLSQDDLSPFVAKIIHLVREPWFHGFLATTDAEAVLKVYPRGTFLVRFSNTKSKTFCISKVSTNKAIKHVVIPYESGKGLAFETTYYQEMPTLVAEQAEKLHLKKACPGSTYAWLFAETKKKKKKEDKTSDDEDDNE